MIHSILSAETRCTSRPIRPSSIRIVSPFLTIVDKLLIGDGTSCFIAFLAFFCIQCKFLSLLQRYFFAVFEKPGTDPPVLSYPASVQPECQEAVRKPDAPVRYAQHVLRSFHEKNWKRATFIPPAISSLRMILSIVLGPIVQIIFVFSSLFLLLPLCG